MELRRPDEIVSELIHKRQARSTINAKQNFDKGLFHGLKVAMAEMVATAIKLVKKHTFSVKVENQIELPKLQQVEDKTTQKELQELKQQLTATTRAVESLEKTEKSSTETLAKALKPEKTDLSEVVKAVKGIKLPETKIPEPVKEITIKNLDEFKKPLAELAAKLKIEFPTIEIPEFPKSITVGNLEAIESLLASLIAQTEQLANKELPQTDIKPLIESVNEVKKTIQNLRFPVPQFNIPKTSDGLVPVTQSATSIGDGRKTVAAAGTPEALSATSVKCRKVDITALSSNAEIVVVGGSTVIAASGTRRGIPLEANDSYSLEIDDLSKVYLDATSNGDGVSFTYFY